MNCDWTKDNIVLYIYEELPDDARFEFERHVQRCISCHAELESARGFKEQMSTLQVQEVSPNLLASSRMQLQESLENAQQARSGFGMFIFDFAGWMHQIRLAPALTAALLIMGFGMTVSVAPLTAAVMSAVPDRQIGVASGVNNAIADIASLLAVAAFGAVGFAVFANALDAALGSLGLVPEMSQALGAIKQTLAGTDLPATLSDDARVALRSAISTAFADSFRVLMLAAAALAALSAACAAATIPREAPS